MKRKIIISLVTLILVSSAGATISTFQIRNITTELNNLVVRHQVKGLRHDLMQNVQHIQGHIFEAIAVHKRDIHSIEENIVSLQAASDKCRGCHHKADIKERLDSMHTAVTNYRGQIRSLLTADLDPKASFKDLVEIASAGNELLLMIEEMAFDANANIEVLTGEAVIKIDNMKHLLFGTITITLILGILLALRLSHDISRPVTRLVEATREILAAGPGHQVEVKGQKEFAELTRYFNQMSTELRDGYLKLEDEAFKHKITGEALRKSEERFSLAAMGANDGLWDWDLDKNMIYLSPRWKSMLDFSETEISSDPDEWFSRVHPGDRKKLDAKIQSHMTDGSVHLESEHRILNKNGDYRWVLVRGLVVMNDQGRACRMVGSMTDITDRKTTEKQLLYDAFHDALTGLPNRELFLNRLEHMIKCSPRQKNCLYAVLIIDLNRFKVVNDSLGHKVGDGLLVKVAERLQHCLRPGDTVARIGADEFAILLENVMEVSDTLKIVERIQRTIPEPFMIEGNEVFTTASIGVALSSEDHIHPEHILRDADIAMYKAKSKGKGTYEIFDPSMHADIVERVRLEADLRQAVERQEFVLHYQPIIDLREDRMIGFEALVRWDHPTRGLIYPLDFIPIAEDTGQIFELGQWILREACIQLREWQDEYPKEPPLKMSLNVSSRQFADLSLSESIATIIDEIAIEPGSLTLEITESMIMENADSAVTQLQNLRKLGVDIHVDDFGTGYSSLSYIHRFPVNALKIDRSFVNEMFSKRESLEIIKAILALASNLNIDVVAEGLELNEQLTQFKGMKCQYAQGYLFSKPMAPAQLNRWISTALILS